MADEKKIYAVIAWCSNCFQHIKCTIDIGTKFEETDRKCPNCGCVSLGVVRPCKED